MACSSYAGRIKQKASVRSSSRAASSVRLHLPIVLLASRVVGNPLLEAHVIGEHRKYI